MIRKIDRGKPLEELLKGSLNYTLYMLRQAFYNQFRRITAFPNNEDFWDLEIDDAFDDGYVLVRSYGGLPPDERYYVTYAREGESYTFAEVEAWEVVELTYQPKQMTESQARQVFIETLDASLELAEAAKGEKNSSGPWLVRGRGSRAGVVNKNKRRYPMYAAAKAVNFVQKQLEENKATGKLILSGEVDHPSDKGHRTARLGETVIKWESIELDGDAIMVEGWLMPTSKGKDLYIQMESGVKPDLSQRAFGVAVIIDEDGEEIEEVIDFVIKGYDAVAEGSEVTAGIEHYESNQNQDLGGQLEMDPKEKEREKRNEGQASQFEALKVINQWIDEKTDNLTQYPPAIRERIKTAVKEAKPDTIEKVKKLIQEQCNEYDQVLEAERARDKALRQQLGLSETDDLATALTEREAERKHLLEEQRKREVAAYIDKEVKGVNYPPIVKNAFLEAVKVDGPTTVEEAKEAIAKHRKHFDKMASELRLQAKGFSGIDVLGPVLEDETGYPEFARVAFEITESFVAHRLAPKRDIYKNAEPTLNEQFALQYLKRFDENYKHHLIAEARQFEEAETTADLSLPYSVMRAIVAEVWATMVAASVFDFGIANNSPDRIYFEEHTKEAGATGSVTDEDFNSGAFTSVNGRSQGEWVQLAHGRIIPGTVVVNVDGGGALIADDDTNYAIDYAAGRIKMFDGGSSDADVAQNTAYEIDYDYDAIREGEGAEIEQAKTVLTFKTLEIGPDRLATDITTEAILFSRSQIGWDAVTRTIFNLVKQIQTRKDQDIFYMALAAVLSISNNFVTWNSGTETVTNLIEKIGQAKTKVRNRHYSADALVISATNADIISNHDHFTAAGKRPDFDLNAQGYIGRVKGLPVFETTNFMDQHIMPVNRELVMHRIFQAMQVEGPYQKYGTNGKLVAAKLYYVEEFNGTDAPVEEKGSSVRIV